MLLLCRGGLLCCWKVCLRDWESTENRCKERWLMEREGEIRFVIYRGDVWDSKEHLGKRAGILGVDEDDRSDTRRNLL